MHKLFMSAVAAVLKRWYVYVSVLVVAWGLNAGWHYVQYLSSPERAQAIMESKRKEVYDEAKTTSDSVSAELSKQVSAIKETKNRYDKAQSCMRLNEKEYRDCSKMEDLDYEIQFIPRYKEGSPSIISVPKASAEESQVQAEPKKEPKFLSPSELLGPTKVSDKCYVSQTESEHVVQKNGGMFATDIACNFGEGLGKRAEVYAPDLRDSIVKFRVEYVGKDELLGSFVQLRVMPENALGEIVEPGEESFYLGHTETKLKAGDTVVTGQRIGQMTMDGATTGWHVHFEYRSLGADGKTWKSERYFTGAREEALDNKRKGNLPTGWKWGDKFYFTHYDLGDVNQNDAAPCYGASGRNLCDLEKNGEKTIALTVDVRNSLGIKFGDKVKLEGPCSGTYRVEDEMNQRFRYACVKKDGLCIKGDIPSCGGGAHTIHKIQ